MDHHHCYDHNDGGDDGDNSGIAVMMMIMVAMIMIIFNWLLERQLPFVLFPLHYDYFF